MPMEQSQQEKDHALTLFCVYAKVDEPFQQALAEHLGHHGQNGFSLEWHRRPVTTEMDWTFAFDSHINTALIILVLLSSDLFLSDYCYSREMQRACERHTLQEASLIPLLLLPVDWQGTPFAQLHLSPLRVSSATRWFLQGEDFLSLVHRIDAAIQHFQNVAPSRIPHPSFPIWHVPSPHNDLFTGREETLTQLSTLLAASQRVPHTQLYALCGPSGIGKTEIAREYAYRFRHDYLSVFWLRADTQHALISAFVSLAECLDLSEHYVQDKMQAVHAVKNWLG